MPCNHVQLDLIADNILRIIAVNLHLRHVCGNEPFVTDYDSSCIVVYSCCYWLEQNDSNYVRTM